MKLFRPLRTWDIASAIIISYAVLALAVLAVDWAYGDEIYNPLSPTSWNNVTLNNPTITGTVSGVNVMPYGAMQQVPGNVIGGNPSGSTADITVMAAPSCSTSSSALNWTTNSGIGCNSSINAATLAGGTFSSPGAIGNGTPGTGAFTSLTINGTTILPVLTGTTNSFGGGLLTVGSCATGTATVTGATTGMVAVASPNTYQGDGVQFQAYVSSANTVTVKACALLLITPPTSTYNVRVLP